MYKEVAFNPACLSEYHYYGLLKKDFGFEQGRYLVASHKEWAREAMQVVKNSTIQPVKKKSIKNFLNNLQRGKHSGSVVLPKDRARFCTVPFSCWEEWWQLQISKRNFSATVSNTAMEGCITYEDIIENSKKWGVKPSIRVSKTPKDIVDALMPLLLLSERALIVDPYLSISSNNVLIELFSRIKLLPNLTSIKIASAIKTKDPQKAFNGNLKQFLTPDISFELIEFPVQYFHDRYVITELGALQLGQGLKDELIKGTHADKLGIHLVSKDDADSVRESMDKALNEGKALLAYKYS